jgi:hypothetical protein
VLKTVWAGLRVVFSALTDHSLPTWDTSAQDASVYEMWAAAAQACFVENLVGKRATFLGPRRIEGVRPPLMVSIAPVGSAGSANAVITIRGVPKGIRLKHETLRTQASKMAGAREIEIGDPDFDAEFFVGGDAVLVRAAFDSATRARALSLFGRRPGMAQDLISGDEGTLLGIEDGAIVTRFVDTGYPHPPLSPSDLLGSALALADRLIDGREEERLAAIARADPLPPVRLAALTTLRDDRPRHPETRAALEAASEDADSQVRLTAAIALGAEGRSTLVALASRVRGPDDVSARAVSELRSHLPADQVRSILAEALRSRRLATAAACLDTLSRSGSHADVVARVLALEGGALGLAAARALGRCGSLDDVPLLREVESRQAKGEELPIACRSAIAAIHTRVPGASPGQLSLAVDKSGQVSLARDETGRVSLTHERGKPTS